MRSAAILASIIALGATVLAGASTSDAAPRRRGKVVRIRRLEPKVTTAARVCTLYDIDVGQCVREVHQGDTGNVLDAEGSYGVATVLESNPAVDACGTQVNWNIQIDQSNLSRKDYSYNAVFVLDHPLGEAAKLLPVAEEPPGGRPGELVSQIIDDDGDGQGDLMVTTYPCDEKGGGTTAVSPPNQCTDYWVEVKDEWRHARTDLMPTCRR